MLECIEVVLLYLGSKPPCVFIFNEVTWLFPSNIYLRESMNREFHTHGDEMDMHECLSRTVFSSRCLIQFCLSFPFFTRYKKKQAHIFIRHSLFTGYFFSFVFGGLFPGVSQYFCSNDIVRIHHIFSLLVQGVNKPLRPLPPPPFTT
jgi:hypothetical protein